MDIIIHAYGVRSLIFASAYIQRRIQRKRERETATYIFVCFRLDVDNSSIDIGAEHRAETSSDCFFVRRHFGFLEDDGRIEVPQSIAHIFHSAHGLDEEDVGRLHTHTHGDTSA